MKLLIVESPAKSKTIKQYLGDDYVVESSLGHIRDLSIKGKGGFGVDIENNFQPQYVLIKEKTDVVERLKKAAQAADHIYLATDPDREGEAISWHLKEVLGGPEEKYSRVVFNEITKKAILKGIEQDRDINMDLVHSQESRRILDRIIGFRLSSLLQQRIGSKSAGRVQSVALKLINDREKEIEAFVPEEYWEIYATFLKNNQELKAKFFGDANGKIAIRNAEENQAILNGLQGATYKVAGITKKQRNRSAKPPFITSTLQQDAGVKFNFSAKRVMMIAQKLYEGVDIGPDRVGLITYMRTDSIRMSDEFISSAKDYIIKKYGEKYYRGPSGKGNKGINVQDAHEAIRPTSIFNTPESLKKYLTSDEFKLYSLIYNRAVASLMSDAIVEDTKIEIEANNYRFQLDGQQIIYDGFLRIYEEASLEDSDEAIILPEFKEGEILDFQDINSEQKFTNPPHRYTEARLIRKMEELGIGRPSTYAIIMDTLRIRGYVTMDKRTFVPTSQGRLTTEQLELFFSDIINVQYTAKMEEILDEISDGKRVWYEELRKFYDQFVPLIENARDNMVKIYPKQTDEFCPVCGGKLLIRRGPYGEFTACSGYPYCKYIKKAPKKEVVSTGFECLVCHEGEIVERTATRGRSKGKTFYACNRYPKCKTTYSGLPTGEVCPECGQWMISVEEGVRCGNERCPTNKQPGKEKKTKSSTQKEQDIDAITQ